MLGSLCFKNGVLYVGRYAITAEVRPYDLDGRELGPGFSFHGQAGARASVRAIGVDDDHRIWVADDASSSVRCFNIFGQELSPVESRGEPDKDECGNLGRVSGVACCGVEEESRLWVASGGRRRHALHRIDLASGRFQSLRPAGDPLGFFSGLSAVALSGSLAFACEAGAGQVQVFRGGDFHFAFRVSLNPGHLGRFEPRNLAPLSDGRLVIVHAGRDSSALLLVDRGGGLLRVLAEHGTDSAQVFEPSGVAVEEGDSERTTRVAVIDRDGDRVQVFTLDGRCFGSFGPLPWHRTGGSGTRPSREVRLQGEEGR